MKFFKKIYNEFRRKANLAKETKYYIVSLGPNCFPKTVLTRWKLKRIKAHGEVTLPFDLAWFHNTKYITEFIENNFQNFFENMKYIEDIKRWDNFGKINFSHESCFGPNDENLLIEMYTNRINNFKATLKTEKPILFVQFLKDASVGEDIQRLYNILCKIRQDKPFELLIIDTDDIIQTSPKNINVYKIKMPYENYDLYSEKCFKSKPGINFEKQIINQCKRIIKNKFKLNIIKYH